MFTDNVFSIPDLTPERLFQLEIRPECNSLEISIKKEMTESCIFRRCEPAATKPIIINDRLPYSTIKAHMKDVGKITGFKNVSRPYCLRYGATNSFEKDGMVDRQIYRPNRETG